MVSIRSIASRYADSDWPVPPGPDVIPAMALVQLRGADIPGAPGSTKRAPAPSGPHTTGLVVEDASKTETTWIVKIFDFLLTSTYNLSYFGVVAGEDALREKVATCHGSSLLFGQALLRHLDLEKTMSTMHVITLSTQKTFRRSLCTLTRMLLADQHLMPQFRAYFRPRTVAMGDLVELLAIFREMTIANLKRIALAEPPQSTLLEQAVTKEHKETIMAKHLQEKLDKHRVSNADVLDSKKKYMESLMRQIATVKARRDEIRASIASRDHQCHVVGATPFESQRETLAAQVATTKAKFAEMKEANRNLEDKLHRRKVAGEAEVQKCIAEYDAAMTKVYDEINVLRADLDDKRERCRFLTAFFQDLDERRAAKAEQERLEALRVKTLERNLRIWACAALLLQRALAKSMRAPSKKKGKGGAKKKKKN
ncbi:Dynein regulatory complex protein 10 [Plasmodiophora brassicae]